MKIENWQEVRDTLLKLHKVLLEYERKAYEGQHGRVESSGKMLNLVMEHRSFAWLRQLSGVVVGLDELLESKEEASEQKYRDMFTYVKKLLTPSQTGNTFEKNYFTALQKSPAAVLAHAKAQKALKNVF